VPKTKGRFAKFVIYGDDPDALASFYTRVFGWKVTRFKLREPPPGAIMIDAPQARPGSFIRGQVRTRDAGSPTNGFEFVVWVASTTRTAAAVERHGGRVVYHAPIVQGIGGVLRFHDPAGNVVLAAVPYAETKRKATSNKRMQLTRSAKANGRRGPRS